MKRHYLLLKLMEQQTGEALRAENVWGQSYQGVAVLEEYYQKSAVDQVCVTVVDFLEIQGAELEYSFVHSVEG